jgi:prepilin-type processing-associated H-X9-DG protein
MPSFATARVGTVRRTALAVVAVVAGLAIVLVAAVALASRGGGDKVGANVLVNRPGPIDVSNSPTVARNPNRDANLVVSFRMDRPGFSAGLYWSDDGGETWTPTTLPVPADVPRCAASPKGDPCPFGPDVAFAPDGTLYVLYVGLRGSGNDPGNLWLSTSTDGGRTLAPPTRVAGELTFQARLAVDPRGPVYATWLQGFGTGNLSFTEPVPYVVAARSDDKGRTFSPPVRVSDPARPRLGGPSPVVDAKGRLSVLYEDYKENRRDFSYLAGPPAEQPSALVVNTSNDGGSTFAPGVEVDNGLIATRRFLIYLPESPQLAAGPGDTLYATWADGRDGDDDVFLRRSSDGGRTWAPAVKVNDNPQDGSPQFLPKVDVAADGRVNVLFLDGRNDKERKVLLDAYLATSTNGGKSFENIRLSDRSFDSKVGPTFGDDYGTDFGTKLGLASASGGKVFAAWTDTREGTQVTGRQDVAFASADLGGGGGAGAGVALGLALVLVVGAVAVVVVATRRRPDRSPPAESSSREPTVPDEPRMTGR